ncbi:hydrogenase iron-sulfur subunit [Candidatus Electronema sp. TJ]|uniref:hydrogenase iron-sulfur subunit n=1 Tax=Candidatus Electronema sp. TJ TaxID=3401573 RepID=UPI003AA7F928
MSFTPDIRLFTCHYASSQSCAEGGKVLAQLNFPANITLTRLACTGKLEETDLLKAFEDGADAVYVVGCPAEGCHNVKGSLRAAKRVDSVRKALAEMGVEADRVRMYHLERGLHPEFIAAAEEMNTLISRLGKSPFCRKAA